MEQQCKQLADGVELLVNRTDKFKTGLLSATLTVPLRREDATAGALIPEVLYRGSRSCPDMERLSAATDALYGASLGTGVRQRGESQCISFLCSVIDDRYALDGSAVLEPAAGLMGEVLLDPAAENGVFRRDYVKGEGANLADRIRARVNDKRSWSIFRLVQEMCDGEAYAVDKLGDAEEALSVSPEGLWADYQALLGRAKVTFYYGGSAQPERVEEAVRRAFAPLISGRNAPVECAVPKEPAGPVRTVTDRMDVTQGKLAMGFRTGGVTMGSPDYPALLVCNALYGGSANSRLFLNVREKLSLCYYASSRLHRYKGLLTVASGIEFANVRTACEEILAQLEAMRTGDWEPWELESAKSGYRNALLSAGDSARQMEDFYLGQLVAGQDDTPEGLLAKIEAVTPERIQAAAQSAVLDTVYFLKGKEEA